MAAAFLLTGIAAGASGGVSREDIPLFTKASAMRDSLSDKMENIFPEGEDEALSVARALTFGDKSGLSKTLKEDYRKSGASHLLALSGLHVGVMYALVSLILSVLGNSRPMKVLRTIISLCILWIYAIITGLGNSISRAAIMITVYQLSDFAGSKRSLPHSLALSALLITLFRPAAPFEIGFQLSYAAMLSICYIYPIIKKILDCRSLSMRYVWNMLSMSIACQIGTSPLTMVYFGYFPKYFMLTNLLAIPLTSAIIYLVPVSAAMASVPELEGAISTVLASAINLLNAILKTIASLN